MSEENVQGKPTPPPLRDVRDGEIPKRRGRPPKVRAVEPVRLPDGVVRAEEFWTLNERDIEALHRDEGQDLPVHVPACDVPQQIPDATITGPSMMVTIDGSKISEMVLEQLERAEQKIELVKDVPLLTLHLRRAKNEITDATGQVHIPASGAIPDGTKLVAHFYREE